MIFLLLGSCDMVDHHDYHYISAVVHVPNIQKVSCSFWRLCISYLAASLSLYKPSSSSIIVVMPQHATYAAAAAAAAGTDAEQTGEEQLSRPLEENVVLQQQQQQQQQLKKKQQQHEDQSIPWSASHDTATTTATDKDEAEGDDDDDDDEETGDEETGDDEEEGDEEAANKGDAWEPLEGIGGLSLQDGPYQLSTSSPAPISLSSHQPQRLQPQETMPTIRTSNVLNYGAINKSEDSNRKDGFNDDDAENEGDELVKYSYTTTTTTSNKATTAYQLRNDDGSDDDNTAAQEFVVNAFKCFVILTSLCWWLSEILVPLILLLVLRQRAWDKRSISTIILMAHVGALVLVLLMVESQQQSQQPPQGRSRILLNFPLLQTPMYRGFWYSFVGFIGLNLLAVEGLQQQQQQQHEYNSTTTTTTASHATKISSSMFAWWWPKSWTSWLFSCQETSSVLMVLVGWIYILTGILCASSRISPSRQNSATQSDGLIVM